MLGASTCLFGAVWTQAELRKVLGIIGADVIDEELVGQADSSFADYGRLLEPGQRQILADLVHVLAARAGAEVRQAAKRRLSAAYDQRMARDCSCSRA